MVAQGRNRTNHTRIFSTTESTVSPHQPDDPQGISRGATERPCPTERIPNRNAAGLLRATLRPCRSTACARPNRAFPELARCGNARHCPSGTSAFGPRNGPWRLAVRSRLPRPSTHLQRGFDANQQSTCQVRSRTVAGIGPSERTGIWLQVAAQRSPRRTARTQRASQDSTLAAGTRSSGG